MDSERFARAKAMFLEAEGLSGSAQDRFLDEACGDDIELRRDVESLLGFREPEVPLADMETADPHVFEPRPDLFFHPDEDPVAIGQYRIIRRLGKGGMGIVYKAIQEFPRRTVALKVIRSDVVHSTLLERFRFETEVLGKLQHPAIAQLFEAGIADVDNRQVPFFAMELVRGRPLDEFMESAKPTLRERLALVQKVASAVHYAHGRGVVHRDLKPANILVSEAGEPKILDFGVARTTESSLKATMHQTQLGQLVGTVPYMSPEQVSGDSDELDARSDVYSLGVILYEVLAGHLPYRVDQRAIVEAIQVICEEEPSKLSSVSKAYRGDVETIVAKALAKQRMRRYQSAHELADDIGRFLSDEPIVARPPSVLYQLQKFSRRHRAIAYGIAAGMAVFMVSSVVVVLLWQQARQARRDADARSGELQVANTRLTDEIDAKSRVIGQLDELLGVFGTLEGDIRRLSGTTAARRQFASSALEALRDVEDIAGADAWYLARLADVYMRIGRVSLTDDASVAEAREALDAAQRLYGGLAHRSGSADDIARSVEAQSLLAQVMVRQGQSTIGQQTIRLAEQRLDELAGDGSEHDSELVLRAKAEMLLAKGAIAVQRGEPETGVGQLREALAVWSRLAAEYDRPEFSDGVVTTLLALSRDARVRGDRELEEQLLREAAATQRTTVRTHPGDQMAAGLLCDVLTRLGDFEELKYDDGDARSLRRLQEALAIANDGIEADPDFVRFRRIRLDLQSSIALILVRNTDLVEPATIGVAVEQYAAAAREWQLRDPGDAFAVRKAAIASWVQAMYALGVEPGGGAAVLERARKHYIDAASTFEWLVVQDADVAENCRDLVRVRAGLADLDRDRWLRSGRAIEEASSVIERCLSVPAAFESLVRLREPSVIESDYAGSALRNAATVGLMVGRYEEAVLWFERADELAPVSADAEPQRAEGILRRRAIACFGIGEAERAFELWSEADRIGSEIAASGKADAQSQREQIQDALSRYLVESLRDGSIDIKPDM